MKEERSVAPGGLKSGASTVWPALSRTALVLCASLGCASPALRSTRWERPPDHTPLPLSVSVVRLQNHRPQHRRSRRALAWIPMVPASSRVIERPGRPKTGIAQVLAKRLKEARVFSSVKYLERVPPEGSKREADLILDGAVRSSRLEATLFTYGLSFLAHPLWILGIPRHRIGYDLRFYLRIVNGRTGEVLWDHEVHEKWSHWRGYYYGRNLGKFPILIEQGIEKAIRHLDAAIAGGALGDLDS